MAIVALSIPLFSIIYEDFRYRAIHWYWIALMFIFILFFYSVSLFYSGINAVFLIIQLSLLTCYFSIKRGKWVNITKSHLGIGDIVYFIPLCLLFSPFNFISFFVASLLISLVASSIYSLFSQNLKTVPLAGCMSIVLICTLIIAHCTGVSLLDDQYITTLLFQYAY